MMIRCDYRAEAEVARPKHRDSYLVCPDSRDQELPFPDFRDQHCIDENYEKCGELFEFVLRLKLVSKPHQNRSQI